MKKKLVYILSEIDRSLHFEWITAHLKENYDLTFVLIGKYDSHLEKWLCHQQVEVLVIHYEKKYDLVGAGLKLMAFLFRKRPDIVHTHLWIANIVGLSAARLAGVDKRIYTRHHAAVHHTEFPSGLKWDRLCNWLATDIIAVSENVKDILLKWDRATASKVKVIHHGFDFSYFSHVDSTRIDNLRRKFGISPERTPVVGVIARFVEWKGIQFVIPAFRKLLENHPQAMLILANANGPYQDQINKLLETLPAGSAVLVKFENDLAALYRIIDVFVHVPIDAYSEAFGQTYVEALIAGVPSIFTRSGVAREFIQHEYNGLVTDFKNSDQIYNAMQRLINNQDLASRLVDNGKKSIAPFTMTRYLSELDSLYLQ